MDPPPLTPALSAVSSATHLPPPAPPHPHTESIESSPRYCATDSWDELTTGAGVPKLRLMCSHGGHIMPRPHDKSLCYVGGDTRMVVVDRNVSLSDLSSRVAKTLHRSKSSFTLKYQLPTEDLDSLISLATDEDLDNMIEENDRILTAVKPGEKGSRLRLFVFPPKSDQISSIGSIGSLLDSSTKSDEWFLSALNGSHAMSGCEISESTSLNCLLGLDIDVTNGGSSNDLGLSNSEFQNGKGTKGLNQDIHSVPDSPMMETTSSFDSTNSTPSLPPIRVPAREEDGGIRAQEQQRVGFEEQFAQISVSAGESFAATTSPPTPTLIPTSVVTPVAVQSTVANSVPVVAGEFLCRVVSDDERSENGVCRKLPQPKSQVQQQQQSQIQHQQQQQSQIQHQQQQTRVQQQQLEQCQVQQQLQQSQVLQQLEQSQVQQQLQQLEQSQVQQQLQQSHVQKQQQQQQLMQQKSSGGVDSPRLDSLSSDGSLANTISRTKQMVYQEVAQVSSPKSWISSNQVDHKSNLMDANDFRVQLQKQAQESGYMLHPQLEQQPQHFAYQPQFIHAGARYVMQQPGNPMVMPSYYPLYPPQNQQGQHPQHQPIQILPHQYPVYIVQAPPPPQQGYNMSLQQPSYPDSTTVVHTAAPQTPPNPNMIPESAAAFSSNSSATRAPPLPSHPEVPATVYRTSSATGTQPMVQAAPSHPQQQFVNYSQVNSPPQQGTSPNRSYAYEMPDPAHAQIYFTQPLGPSLISQYQTMKSGQVLEASNQPQNDSLKQPPQALVRNS